MLPVAPCSSAPPPSATLTLLLRHTHAQKGKGCEACAECACLHAPESVGGTLEKVSAWGAGVERMAARASATTACAAGADIPRPGCLRGLGSQATSRRRRRDGGTGSGRHRNKTRARAPWSVASRNPGIIDLWCGHRPATRSRISLAGCRITSANTSDQWTRELRLEEGRYDGPTCSRARPDLYRACGT